MTGPTRATRAISAPALLCSVICLFLALAATAHASPGQISMSPPSPVVGESITFNDAYNTDCGVESHTFTVDGVARAPQASATLTTSFAAAGSHSVSVFSKGAGNCSGNTDSDTLVFEVRPGLVGSISVSPDPPAPRQTATLAATQTGGTPGYTYEWDTDNDGQFDDATTRTVETVFTTTGPHVVRVRIRDSAAPKHETVVDRTLNVQDPPADAPPPPPPAPCVKQLAFALSEFKTEGCFKQTATSPSEQWETTSAVKLNGIPFPDFGQTFRISFPTSTEPGGHFTAPDSTIQLGGLNAYSGDIDWALPAGGQGSEKLLRSIQVALGAKIFGLNVRGTIGLKLGWAADGKHYATVPLNVELPAGFETGPSKEFSRATGAASLRVDDAGIHNDGLQLRATNVWLGKLKVVETCFSFVPSGGQSVSPCAAPSLDGAPYITCSDDVNTDRWDGNAILELPGSHTQLAAFGGLANGNVSKLGGFADNLGRRAPIAPNVYLDRIGVGLCLTPPPLKLRGDVGIGILPTPSGATVAINGRVLYTDSDGAYGWKVEVGGTVKVFNTQVGEGSVTLRAYDGVDFRLQAGFNLYDVASLDGLIQGWVDSARGTFSVSGSARACVGGTICANGSGLVSSTGAAGCVTIVSTASSPDLLISLDPFRVRFDNRPVILTAGFGYRWGQSSVDVFGSSCDFASYTPTRVFARVAGEGGAIPQKIARGTAAVSLRIHGTNGPPKVLVRGPGGTTIASPADGHAMQSKGHWMLIENKSNGTTNLLLIRPKAGTWTVDGALGAMSTPTTIDRAKSEAHPTIAAKVHGAGHRRASRWPTRCRRDHRCDSSSAPRVSAGPWSSPSGDTAARVRPRCAPAATRPSSVPACRSVRPAAVAARERSKRS